MPRNSSGTYSLPSGNPVVSNTLIQSTWANNTCSDLGTSITDSLDRNGRGAMLAALKNIDGTAVAPSITFSSEGTLGIFRSAAGVLGIAAGGALVLSIASTGLTFTNPLVLPVGSATAPSVTFTANTNTGLYSPGTNQVALTTNGVQRLAIDASGVVTIAGASTLTGAVGIGGANALGKLQVIGGDIVIDNGANYSAKNSGGTASSIMALSAANQLQFGNSGAVTSTAWATGGTTRMTLDSSGNLGIGTSPTAPLHVLRSGSNAVFRLSSSGGSGRDWNFTSYTTGALSLGSDTLADQLTLLAGNVGVGGAPSTLAKLMSAGGFYITGAASLPAATGPGLSSLEGTILREYVGDGTGYSRTFSKRTASTTTDLITITDAGTINMGLATAFIGHGATTGVLSIGAASALADGIARIELYDTAHATLAKQVAYRGDAHVFTKAAAATPSMTITTTGVIQDGAGIELGYKGLPQNSQGGAYTLVASDRGKQIYMNNVGNVTVPTGVFSTGDVVTIINGEAGTFTLVQGASTTLYQAGTSNTGNRTVLTHGICTIVCTQSSTNSFFVSGNIT